MIAHILLSLDLLPLMEGKGLVDFKELFAALKASARDYYQLKIYHYKTKEQETRLEQYLRQR